jgi:hypothetical protein
MFSPNVTTINASPFSDQKSRLLIIFGQLLKFVQPEAEKKTNVGKLFLV